MGAVWYRARAELRRRWRSTLVLAVLAGLAGGIVLASVAGARRTGSAMDRSVEFNRPTLFVGSGAERPDEEAVRALPEVVSLGSPAPPVVPVLVVALVPPLALLVAAAVAAGPARSAAATEPAAVLRSE